MNASTKPLTAATAKPRRAGRGWWLKQLHSWHWISAAVSLVGMLAFAITGVTLNHADIIPGKPVVVDRAAVLAPSLRRLLASAPAATDAPLPAPVAAAVADAVGVDPGSRPGEWSDAEVYVALPRAGGDAWVSVDRTTGAIKAETTSQGLVALLNDLHKGRNTGLGWRLFIDAFAAAAIVFSLTGLLLLQLHARHRRATWPLVALGAAVPLVIFILLVHY